jgi:hypothetical protein
VDQTLLFKPMYSVTDQVVFGQGVSMKLPSRASHISGAVGAATSPGSLSGGRTDSIVIPVINFLSVVVNTLSVTATGGADFNIFILGDMGAAIPIWTGLQHVAKGTVDTIHISFPGGLALLPTATSGTTPPAGTWDLGYTGSTSYRPTLWAYSDNITASVGSISAGIAAVLPSYFSR